MENSMSRLLIETTVRHTLKGLKEDPKRSVRNLVDMALHFSEGRFQSHFFQTAHTMLEHEESAYYALIEDAVSHIETEHLVTFGMNLGYNSCTWGAQRIRTNEQRLGSNIPWTVLFQMEDAQLSTHLPQYDRAIQEGEELGIYSWGLLSQSNPMQLFPLMEGHSDSAFFLFCRPEEITPSVVDEMVSLKHLMPVVQWDDGTDAACALLRDAQLPYSVYYPYTQQDLPFILNGELFCETQQLHPLFTILAARPGCPSHIQTLVHQAAVQARNGQTYETVPWELYSDIRTLDEVISDDACCVFLMGRDNCLRQITQALSLPAICLRRGCPPSFSGSIPNTCRSLPAKWQKERTAHSARYALHFFSSIVV